MKATDSEYYNQVRPFKTADGFTYMFEADTLDAANDKRLAMIHLGWRCFEPFLRADGFWSWYASK